MSTEAVLETLAVLWKLLRRENIPAALAGGMALATWKHPRTTHDVDILIGVDLAEADTLLETFADAGFLPTGKPPVQFQDTQLFQFRFEHEASFISVKVDLLVACSDFAKQALRRTQTLESKAIGFELDVLSCEDLILFKLLAGRIIDLADATELVRANSKSLDWGYLSKTSAKQNLTLQLDAIRKEAAQ